MKKLLLVMMLAILVSIGFAQVAGYTFGYSAGTYTEITGGTVLGTCDVGGSLATSLDNVTYWNVPIPFFFPFNGRQYTQVGVNSNGYLIFGGSTALAESGQLSSSTAAEGVVVAYGKDNQGIVTSGSLGQIRYETLNAAPNRVFVIQWKNFRDYNASGDMLNFQIRLYETTKVVEFVYGNIVVVNSETAQVGLRGTLNTDFHARTTTTNWTASTLGATNAATMTVSATIYPPNGTTFTFTPPAASTIPNVATPVYPTDAATGIPNYANLSWTDGGGWTNGFKLYLGTTTPPPYVADLGYTTTYDPPVDFAPTTVYYWKLEPYNGIGEQTTGAIWSFTTAVAPLSGTKTIGTGGDFANFTAAINALNSAGVGTGGVTFNVADGTYNESPPAITMSGTATKPIVFQAAVGANPVVTPAGGTGTFGFKLAGADYITFDNIDVTGPNTLIYGYWLSAQTTNGCTNITIKNSTITIPYGSSTNYGVYSLGVTNGGNNSFLIQNNTIVNPYHGLYFSGSSGAEATNGSITGNTITAIRNYGIYFLYNSNGSVTNNTISCYANASTAFYGIYTASNINTNTVSGNTVSGGYTSSTVYGIYHSSGSCYYYNNTITNVINTLSSSWYGLYAAGGTSEWNANNVYGVTNTGTASVYGIYTTTGDHIFRYNSIHDITTGGSSVYGIYIIGGTSQNIYGNKVYALTYSGTGSGIIYGIAVSGGTTNNVYNNMVYDLRNNGGTTAPQVRGIGVTSGTTDNIWNNSVYLNSSGTNTNYASAAFYVSGGTTIDLKNNIFVNASTPGATGRTVAFFKTTTTVSNLSTTSDKNIYYAGTPDATHLIGYFSTTAYPTFEEYKVMAATKDQGSYTENVPYLSTTSPYDLHIDPTITTRVEGNALPIPTVAFDIDAQARNASFPDIGADEGNFLAPQGVPGNVTLVNPTDGATGINPITGTLTWSAPGSGATPTEYWVYVATDRSTIFDESFTSVAAPTTSVSIAAIQGLTVGFGSTYYWAVQAHNAEGESDVDDPAFQIWGFSTRGQMDAASTLALGSVWPENRKTGTIPVQNLGTTPLTLTATGSPEFTFTGGPSFTIPASTTYNLPYEFTAPATLGAYAGGITLTETNPGAQVIAIDVSATISTDIIIGTGTTELNIPVDPYFGYSYSQTIYYPSELNWPAGYRINKIYYYFNGYEVCEVTKNFVIYMGHTTNSTFATTTSWIPLSGLTQVYSHENIPQLVAGGYWMEFILDTPFIYNGTDNLVIAVEENMTGFDSTSSFFYSTATTGVNRSILYTNDSTNPDPAAPPTGTLVAGYPNTKIMVELIPTTPAIHVTPDTWNYGNVIINNTADKQFSITNTGGGTLSVSNITIAGSGAMTLTGLPTFPVNLTAGQSTTFTVHYAPTEAGTQTATVSINDNRAVTTVDVTGVCVDPRITALPHTQNFDAVTVPALPLGWGAIATSVSAPTYVYVKTTTSTPQSAPNNVGFYNSSDTAPTLILTSPQVTIPLNQVKLDFWARWYSYSANVVVGTMTDPANAATFTPFQTITPTSTNAEYVVSLATYAGTDQYVAFKMTTSTTYSYIYLDTVVFQQILANDMAATAISGSGLITQGDVVTYDVTVRNDGTAVQNVYDVHLKRYGDDRLASVHVTTPLDPGATAVHTITWTANIAGSLSLVGEVELTGDGNATNNETAVKNVMVMPTGTTIHAIGDPASTTTVNSYPINMFYKNGVTEALYFPEELQMLSGTIIGLSYKNNFTQELLNKPIKIWMATTTASDLGTAWLPAAGFTLVFDGTVNFPLGINEIMIPLNTPYNYTGGNLVVRVNRPMDTAYFNTSNHFYYTATPAHTGRTRYVEDDNTAYDPMAPWEAGSTVANVPNTKFAVTGAVPMTLDVPAVTISYTGANVTVSWTAVPNANSYLVYMSDDPYSFTGTPVTVGTTSYTTAAAGMKFFKVVASTQAPAKSFNTFTPAPMDERK